MKIQFLQHIYTWSDHGITGNKLGWGISASSIPESVTVLREIEKLASETEPDRVDHVPVEEMIYSPAAGFVRMRTTSLPQGEDGRNNKLVRILQPVNPEDADPAVCFAGLEEAFMEETPPETEGDLPLMLFDPMEDDPDDILDFMHLKDKLPIFLRAVFWCLLEYNGSLNIVAPWWDKEEFSLYSGRFMYAVHCMLPKILRKKAGYRSYAWKENSGTAFYFSREMCGNACFDLSRNYPADTEAGADELSAFYFRKLASCWREDRDQYLILMDKISDYLEESAGNGMELKKIQWLFYDLVSGSDQEPLSREYILKALPDLMFWGSREEIFRKITARCLQYIHESDLTSREEELYKNVLLEKVSKRNLSEVCLELKYLLEGKNRDESGQADQDLIMIREKNKVVYEQLKADLLQEEGWEPVFSRIDPREPEEENSQDKARTEPGLPAGYEEKDETLPGEPGLLREEEIQLESSRRLVPVGESETADTGSSLKKKESQSNSDEAEYRVLGEEEEIKEDDRSFSEFLLSSLPTGFLTGCVMFLSHYSLMIGHWKIAVGMGGMWLILILNYAGLLKSTQARRPLWMGIGLCILEGELIEIVASYFVDQRFRLLYFIILGAIAAAVQVLHIIRLLSNHRNKT